MRGIGLDARQGQFLAEDVREFLKREIDLEDVAAGLIPRAPLAFPLRLRQRLPRLTFALADAARVLAAVAELRQLDARDGDADEVAPFFADHFTARDVLGKVAFDLAAHDLAKALMITFDFLSHGSVPGACSFSRYKAFANSSTVSPALRMRLLKVPFATGLWAGIDNVAIFPSLVMTMWLFLWRATCQPNDANALITFRYPTEGGSHQATTST
jgi:hypothetical protein